MLTRLTLRWRLTLAHTGVFLVVGALVVTMVYLQNRIVITRVGDVPATAAGPVLGGRTEPGAVDLLDAISLQRDDAIGTILLQWITALVIMTVLVGLLAWWVTGRVLNRVHAITSQARRISTDNLHERIAMAGPDDELRELADTLDELLTRLDGAFSAQARFIANASHELRTPLAVARTTLQVGLATSDPERVQVVREDLLRNNERCIALINGLLTLARGEQGGHRPAPVALDEVVDEAIGEAVAGAAPKVLVDRLEPCVVAGDQVLLAQLVRNLLDNAVRYNVPGGEVLVRLTGNGHLTITNTGPVVGPEDAERLFEPFYRGAGRTGEGAGLGLSIVRAIAASHGGRATARPLSGGGLAVEVHLPARVAVS
ncbi:sensor histidine kinase [Actinoplanes palleronii]|uniref:histidine kinase n=1 Tax=Actinoplanes palleronii TaxID=113570 RepID=A0ABQ4BP17_9ACTN|nr:HAMP domain-containing sensor histidine kinase [Actinoplanes palleronii]GIE72427.1 two-component sensor histidine kinase [Actinoplanes palleronii]